ncbi:bifunctional diguanylate cyclase/phosphodiesterase [uncultured Neptuniibacter sp.]|uniref:putative bifunctional diguanylate cyclase/phosphodiesterase n=1 Tax=uncultured Neptuniibacter sp. TaxID=502143 RepID=UPI002608A780|nr:bifunctional diguanylate cyclase/phosphodiesterase [uncultured Neptuniibacter sp.]
MSKALRLEPDRPKSILLIDIDGISRQIPEALIESTRKHRLVITHTFSDGMLCQKQNRCDVILLACNTLKNLLPKIISKLHNFQPDVPIIILAPDLKDDEGELLIQSNALDYVSISEYTTDTLSRSIRYAFHSSEQLQIINELRDSDSMTGLGNRQYFLRTLESSLESIKTSGNKLAIISLDINNFRALNNRHGQHNGDTVVIELGQRIAKNITDTSIAARIGNDEFTLLIETSPFEDVKQMVTQMLNRIIHSLNQPIQYGNVETSIKCSIGISLAPEHGYDPEQLVHRAVLARQESKKAFDTRYTFFSSELEDSNDLYSELAPEIAFALRSNQFVLHYQPQINLKTGQIEGAETLIRWNHPERGLLYPDSFIPICEQMGLIVPIGYWIIHQACHDLNNLIREGIHLEHLGVNLSFRQFGDENLVPTIERILNKTKTDTSILELELTESTLHDDQDHVISCLESLSEMGLSFSLDDFGTGYSSFSMLQKLPIDTIKIDRSFITDVTVCDDDAEIVRAIINLAHNMGKKVIAEGVENQDQLDFLVSHNCDIVQGFFFSRPVDFETFKHTLLKCSDSVAV